MVLKLFLIVFVVATTVYGDNLCCFPDKWQAQIVGLNIDSYSGNDIFAWREEVFFDTAGERIRENFPINDSVHISYLRLYKQNTAYAFDGKKCEKYKLPDWSSVVHCVPKDARATPKYRLGVSPGINIVDYFWNLAEGITQQISVTDKCSPVFINTIITGENDNYDMVMEEVQNFVPAISNMAVFDVPPECKKLSQLIPTLKGIKGLKQHTSSRKHVYEHTQLLDPSRLSLYGTAI